MEEIKLIAKAKNIYLPEDIIAKTMEKQLVFSGNTDLFPTRYSFK
jgi:2-dehydropantoate 2-reductase